jgi:archaemetzincin
MERLSLVPIYFGSRHESLGPLSDCLAHAFHVEVQVRTPWFDPERAFDASRGQYHSTILLQCLLGEPPARSARVLGVTDVDLFIPVLTYVFGEAQLRGTAAVVSSRRLQNEAYGLPPDDARMLARLKKEAVHELGHTYGLLHCHDAQCVMHASTYVEEIDLKSDAFCHACARLIDLSQPAPAPA